MTNNISQIKINTTTYTIRDKNSLPLSGSAEGTTSAGAANMAGPIWFYDVDGIKINSKNTDINVWEVVGNGSNFARLYGYYLLYKGTGNGNLNTLDLYSHNLESGNPIKVYSVTQNGNIDFTNATLGTKSIATQDWVKDEIINGTGISVTENSAGKIVITNTVSYSNATLSKDGLMSSSDKKRLDATYNLVFAANSDTTINNLNEVLTVLQGISDTDTILNLLGKYLPLTGGVLTGPLATTTLTLTAAQGTAPFTITSKTLVNNLNSDLLDGYHASDLLGLSVIRTGKMLYRDPFFKLGNNNISDYQNSGSGITITRVAKQSSSPLSSEVKYELKITKTSAVTPGNGGFYFYNLVSRKGAVFLFRIIANIPSGLTLSYNTNAYGSDGNFKWLTDTVGTGKYKEYILKVNCGTSGTFSTIGYFYLSGSTTNYTAYIGYATCFDLTAYDDLGVIRRTDAVDINAFSDDTYIYDVSSALTSSTFTSAKPTNTSNAVSIMNFHTYEGNFYSLLCVDTRNNKLHIRSANDSTSWGAWQSLLTRAEVPYFDLTQIYVNELVLNLPTANRVWYVKIASTNYILKAMNIYAFALGNNMFSELSFHCGTRENDGYGYQTMYNKSLINGIFIQNDVTTDVFLKLSESCTSITVRTSLPNASAAIDSSSVSYKDINTGFFVYKDITAINFKSGNVLYTNLYSNYPKILYSGNEFKLHSKDDVNNIIINYSTDSGYYSPKLFIFNAGTSNTYADIIAKDFMFRNDGGIFSLAKGGAKCPVILGCGYIYRSTDTSLSWYWTGYCRQGFSMNGSCLLVRNSNQTAAYLNPKFTGGFIMQAFVLDYLLSGVTDETVELISSSDSTMSGVNSYIVLINDSNKGILIKSAQPDNNNNASYGVGAVSLGVRGQGHRTIKLGVLIIGYLT